MRLGDKRRPMFNFSKLYHNPNKEDLNKRQKILAETEKTSKQVAKLANKCLKSSDFARYRNAALDSREKIYKSLETFMCIDPIQYAFVVTQMIANAKALTQLLEGVERDTK